MLLEEEERVRVKSEEVGCPKERPVRLNTERLNSRSCTCMHEAFTNHLDADGSWGSVGAKTQLEDQKTEDLKQGEQSFNLLIICCF